MYAHPHEHSTTSVNLASIMGHRCNESSQARQVLQRHPMAQHDIIPP